MASFLVGIVGVFHAANFASSSAFLKSKKQNGLDPDRLDEIHDSVKAGFAPEKTEDLRQLLTNINQGVAMTQNLSGQIAQAVLGLSTVLGTLNQKKS